MTPEQNRARKALEKIARQYIRHTVADWVNIHPDMAAAYAADWLIGTMTETALLAAKEHKRTPTPQTP